MTPIPGAMASGDAADDVATGAEADVGLVVTDGAGDAVALATVVGTGVSLAAGDALTAGERRGDAVSAIFAVTCVRSAERCRARIWNARPTTKTAKSKATAPTARPVLDSRARGAGMDRDVRGSASGGDEKDAAGAEEALTVSRAGAPEAVFAIGGVETGSGTVSVSSGGGVAILVVGAAGTSERARAGSRGGVDVSVLVANGGGDDAESRAVTRGGGVRDGGGDRRDDGGIIGDGAAGI
jgi:hypothetical protein